MTDWKTVHDSRKKQPETIDTNSSAFVVYQRRNIRRETFLFFGHEVEMWTYEQRELSREEYYAEAAAQLRADVDFLAAMEGIVL